MVACRLNFWRPSTTVISIGMGHLYLLKLLLVYLNRLTSIIKYIGVGKISFQAVQWWIILTRGPAMSPTEFRRLVFRTSLLFQWALDTRRKEKCPHAFRRGCHSEKACWCGNCVCMDHSVQCRHLGLFWICHAMTYRKSIYRTRWK